MNYVLHLGIFISIYGMLAVGLGIMVGYMGRLSLLHVVSFAIGAYAFALGQLVWGVGVFLSVVIGIVAAALLSSAFVLLTHRRYSDEYILVCLALQSTVHGVFSNWYDTSRQFGSLYSFTNGPFGVSGIPSSHWFGEDLFKTFLITSLVFFGSTALVASALNGPWGRSLRAVRDDLSAAQNLGISAVRLHLEAALVASPIASLAGAMYAAYVSYIGPDLCNLDLAILILSMVIIGGAGSRFGPVVGAVTLLTIPEVLKALHIPSALIDNLRFLLYGLTLTLFMHFRPQGIVGPSLKTSLPSGQASRSDRAL